MHNTRCLWLLSMTSNCNLLLKSLLSLPHAPLVISEMPYESFAHWPVEVLPLVRPRDQRKAAELQVRLRVTTSHLLLHSPVCNFSLFLTILYFIVFYSFSGRRWPRRTTLRWIKSAWRLCPIRFAPLRNDTTTCVLVHLSQPLSTQHPSCSFLHQIWVDYINFLKGV